MKKLEIGFLGPCPICWYDGAHVVDTGNTVEGELDEGDLVTCVSCGASGEISVDDGAAFVEWEDVDN